MVCQVVSAEELGAKGILRCQVLTNDQYSVPALLVRKDHHHYVIDQTSRLSPGFKFILQQ